MDAKGHALTVKGVFRDDVRAGQELSRLDAVKDGIGDKTVKNSRQNGPQHDRRDEEQENSTDKETIFHRTKLAERLEFITDAVDRDETVFRMVAVNFLADALDMRIHRARVTEVVITPDL